MSENTHTHLPTREAAEPKDGYGIGYLIYSLAADFHALCCMAGPEAARQEIAEIINAEFERKRP